MRVISRAVPVFTHFIFRRSKRWLLILSALAKPVAEMVLPVTIESSAIGDTPAHRRQRQKLALPDILLTTPEQLALLLAGKDAAGFLYGFAFVIFDELHALVTSKRGSCWHWVARLRNLAPQMRQSACRQQWWSRMTAPLAGYWCRAILLHWPDWLLCRAAQSRRSAYYNPVSGYHNGHSAEVKHPSRRRR